jgi:hypothetical protein
MTLVVTLQDGRTGALMVPEGMQQDHALTFFVEERHPFAKPWIKLVSGEYVRKSFVVSIRPSDD